MAKQKTEEAKVILDYQPHTVDYSKEKVISHSQLATYVICPYAWHLTKRKKLGTYTPSIHTVFGTSFHETVQEWLDKVFNGKPGAGNYNLHEVLREKLKVVYKAEYEKLGNHFTNTETLQEFYDDGCAILDYLVKNKRAYFNRKTHEFIGSEIPIMMNPLEKNPSVWFTGYLDLVFYCKNSKSYEIWDIKTSSTGWSASQKMDPVKNMQLILYKTFFAKQFNVPLDNIKVKFFIVRRKQTINPYTNTNLSRVQEYIPQTGPKKIKETKKTVDSFVETCFTLDGKYTDVELFPTPSKEACKWCIFKTSGDCEFAI